jgi:penicillin amidase
VPGLRRVAFAAVALLVAVVLVVLVTVVVTVRRPLPDWSGSVEVPGLSSDVEVLRDERGVPQIYADTAGDLFHAQGYVHAQDRFFEMDLRRHITAGRLSELVGENQDALEADRVVRTLGWRRVAEQELPLLAPDTRDHLQAYADGVNAYIEDRAPAELSAAYSVLDVVGGVPEIEPWTPVDSLAWLKAMAWDLRSNYDEELGRAIAYGRVGDVELVNTLYPPYPADEHAAILPGPSTAGASLDGALRADDAAAAPAADDETLRSVRAGRSALESAEAALDAVPALLGRGDGIGSNSWVVSGAHTESGRPLLANDPHLAPGMPSIWYQVGLHCTQVDAACPFEVAGFSFSGLPGVVIGHNADIAWGMTNLGPDVSDFFLEDVADDTYLRDGQQVEIEVREETIRVAGGNDVPLTIRSTVHGPLISDVLETVDEMGGEAPTPEPAPFSPGGYEVALSWTALEPGRTADAIFALNEATNWDEFRAAAELFEVPSQNLVYADTDGHIGYQAPGRIPVRRPGSGLGQADGTWPRPGWDSDWDWQGYIPFQDLPSVRDPAEGFVVAANQQVVGAQYPYRITSDWDYGYRSQRIREVLTETFAAGEKVDASDMTALQTDTRNGLAEALVPSLLAAPPSDVDNAATRQFTDEAVQLLRDWDYTQPARQSSDVPENTSAAAAYFNAVWSNLLRLTFQDQLPPSIHPDGGGRWFRVVTDLLADKDNAWWDDFTTPTITESRDQVIGQALKDARLELTASLGKDPTKWEWGKLHTLELEQQPLGGEAVPAPVRELFNSDRYRMGGGSSIVLATGWDAAEQGSYTVDWVPSMRMVVDLDDLDRSTWVDLTGVSGHPWSGHYGDQTEAWVAGETYPWPFGRSQIERAAEHTLVLRPVPEGE